jgi:hypothetical protein
MVTSTRRASPPDLTGVHAQVVGDGGRWAWAPRHADGRLAWDAIGIHLKWNQHGGFHRSEHLAQEAADRAMGR